MQDAVDSCYTKKGGWLYSSENLAGEVKKSPTDTLILRPRPNINQLHRANASRVVIRIEKKGHWNGLTGRDCASGQAGAMCD